LDAAVTGDNSITRFWAMATGLDGIGEGGYMGYITGVELVNGTLFSSQVHFI
jgi:hypothetical protein